MAIQSNSALPCEGPEAALPIESTSTLPSEEYGASLSNHLPTLWHRFRGSGATYPNELALACLHQPHDLYGISAHAPHETKPCEYLRWTYKQLLAGVDTFAHNLKRLGVEPGMPISTFLYNGAEYALAMWAAHKLGCPLGPINPRNFVNADEVTHMLKTGAVSVAIVGDVGMATKLDALQAAQIKTKIGVTSEPTDTNWYPFSAMMDDSGRNTWRLTEQGAQNGDAPMAIFLRAVPLPCQRAVRGPIPSAAPL